MRLICPNCSDAGPSVTCVRQRSELEIEYQENLKTFKPSYPLMVQIRSKIDEIDRQLAAAGSKR